MKKILAGFLFVSFCFASISYASTDTALTPKKTIEQRKLLLKQKQEQRLNELKMKKEAASKPSFSKGTFIVGKDIQPWTYRTRSASSGCHFSRVKWFWGTMDEIITNGFTNSTTIITIDASDKWFISKNCVRWTQDLSQITKSKTSFSDGMFFVGVDIEAGTYKNSWWDGCYYSRLSGFSEKIKDIISNEFTNEVFLITIDASDKWFKSNGCGTWTKI